MKEILPALEDDGLITPDVDLWAEDKYRIVLNYATIFATGMKNEWEVRVYIDLYAGAGRSRIKGTSRILPASPTLALMIKDPFDHYIFCEQDVAKLGALKTRAKRDYSNLNTQFIAGDVTKNIEQILSYIPKYSKNQKVLTFCFIDPYNIRNFSFNLISELSVKFMDFLILIPSYMDANRNVDNAYILERSMHIENFTGIADWRDRWRKESYAGRSFGAFLPDLFGSSMKKLGYIYSGSASTIKIRANDNNRPLYHLAFFSKHEKGMDFWEQVKRYSTDQIDLF